MIREGNIDRVIVESYGRWDKLYELANNLKYIDCFVYDETSFKGMDKGELFNLHRELARSNTIIMQVQ